MRTYGRAVSVEVLMFMGVAGVLVWFLARGFSEVGYNWQWYRIPHYFLSFKGGSLRVGPLLSGLLVTLEISILSLLMSLAFGLTVTFLRLSGLFSARLLSLLYLTCIRNTPLLIQIFFIYFVISPLLGMSRFASAILTLSLFEGAYSSEIIRAGILSVERGQWEAAYSVGMSKAQAYRFIVLPQALRNMLPPLTSQAVSLVKDSALVSTIAIYDLTMQAQVIVSETFLTFEIWFTVAVVYLTITLFISWLAGRMEQRMKLC